MNTSDAGRSQRGVVPLSWHTDLLKFLSAATEFQLTDDQGVEPNRQKRLFCRFRDRKCPREAVLFWIALAPMPDVPVTLTVNETGVQELEGEDEDLSPRPVNSLSPITLTASRSSICMLRRLFESKKQGHFGAE